MKISPIINPNNKEITRRLLPYINIYLEAISTILKTINAIRNVIITLKGLCKCNATQPGTMIPPAVRPIISVNNKLNIIPRPIDNATTNSLI